MQDQFDAHECLKSLYEISKIFMKTKLDGSFQRWGGYDKGSGWTTPQGNQYLKNLTTGKAFNFILVVDLRYAAKEAEYKKDMKSRDYFNKLLEEGFEYLSIDGNNSSSYIYEFINDNEEVTIDGARISDFDEEYQNDLKYVEKMKFIALREIGLDDCASLFRDLNTATSLNAQEHRQARLTQLSKFIRDAANIDKTRTMFINFLYSKTSDLDKRFHEELLARQALKIFKNYKGKTGAPALDDFYENQRDLPNEVKNNIISILDAASKMASKAGCLKNKLNKGKLTYLWDLIYLISVDKSFKILDHEALFRWFLKKDNEFLLLAKNTKFTEDEMKTDSYQHWLSFPNQDIYWNKAQTLFESAFLKDMDKLINDKTISYRRSHKDRFTWDQYRELLHKQNFKTRTGKNIDILDLYLGEFEADHMISVANGGETTIENGELMTKEENRKKGSNDNEPYFPHQKPEEKVMERLVAE